MAAVTKKAEHEGLRTQHGAVDPARALLGERRIGAPEGEEISVERQRVAVATPLAEVELAALERGPRLRLGQARLGFPRRDTGELAQELRAPALHGRGQLGVVVSEVEERARGEEFLPLE